MSESYWIYAVGLAAQLLFSARLIIQWIRSEQSGRVLSPTIFWQLSLIASFLLIAYGILRDDPIIIFGQVISYFIYIRNLQYKGAWKLIPPYFKVIVLLFPIATILWLAGSTEHSWNDVIGNPSISNILLIWGALGQIVFALRFVYQWYFSEKLKKSVLPLGFWIISMVGSLLIVSYGFFRYDPVLILGQAFGIIAYARNIQIGLQAKKVKMEAKPL
jgi:lipid-A-disaccharide synthase-like uncharacterized protein